MMKELIAVYALWLRELKGFLREKGRVIGAVATPVMWFVFMGAGIGATAGGDYQHFIYPGIIGMTILFTCMFHGTYIIWDKKVDFFKEVLVAPISRLSIFWGKALGGMTQVVAQLAIMILIGVLFGISFTPYSLLMTIFLSLLISVFFLAAGIILGVYLDSMESFGLVINFIMYPLFFLSGALYSLEGLPSWLSYLTMVNPLTYGIDGLRNIILGTSSYPLMLDIAVIVGFGLAGVILGTLSFRKLR